MTAAWLADRVTSNIRGSEDAKRLIASFSSSCCTGDELAIKFAELAELGDVARLRGFARQIQKVLERAQ